MRVIGDKALIRRLRRLPFKLQGKVIRPSLRAGAKDAKVRVVSNLSGGVVDVDSGRLKGAVVAQSVRALPRRKWTVGAGVELPTRASLAIDPGSKSYYPGSLEYGYTRTKRAPVRVRAFKPFRLAIDRNRPTILSIVTGKIRSGALRLWKRG